MEPVARHFLALFLAFIVIVIVIEAEVYGTCCQLMLEREHEDITVHEVQIYSVSMRILQCMRSRYILSACSSILKSSLKV